jgi:hypothetical protein
MSIDIANLSGTPPSVIGRVSSDEAVGLASLKLDGLRLESELYSERSICMAAQLPCVNWSIKARLPAKLELGRHTVSLTVTLQSGRMFTETTTITTEVRQKRHVRAKSRL